MPFRIGVVLLAWAVAGGLGSMPSPARADIEALIGGELRVRAAADAGDRATLEGIYRDLEQPGPVRGRALWQRNAGLDGPMSAAERSVLLKALRDPSAAVRRAALRAVGRRGERPLEREALKLSAEDPDAGVRLEALRTIRPWSRQGHLYFLEQALAASWVQVRAEALVNLAQVALRELPAEVVSRVRDLAGPDGQSDVRVRALEALAGWERLEWRLVFEALADWEAPERLKLTAMRLSDAMPDLEERDEILLDSIGAEPSLLVAWEAYRRLKATAGSEGGLAPVVARYLVHVDQKNAATEDMAAFLESQGYRVVYRAGSWKIVGRQ